MKCLALLVTLFVLLGVVSSDEELKPDVVEEQDVSMAKRGFLQFYAMVRSQTGRDPMDFYGYGCWCGVGGKGTPLDAVDRCCQAHDLCYNHIIYKGYCGRYKVYYKNYYYSELTCYTGWLSSHCGRSICRCDVAAVKCFKQHLHRFNNRYKNWNKSTCK